MPDNTPNLRDYFDELAAPLDAQPIGPPASHFRRTQRALLAAATVAVVAFATFAISATRSGDEAGVVDDSAGLPPFCSDVPEPDPRVSGDLLGSQSPDAVFMGVLNTYMQDNADTSAGTWFDRGKGAVVMAFTDPPQVHEAAIAELRASEDDAAIVDPPPEITETTTIAQSPYEVADVQVPRSRSELEQILAVVRELVAGALGLYMFGIDESINRITLALEVADEPARARLAAALPVDAICVDGPAEVPTPVEADSVDLLAVEDDPIVECANVQFRLSALDEPADFEQSPGDLADALRHELATAPEGMPGTNHETGWRVLAYEDDVAHLAAGTPPLEYLSFRNEGGRWVWAGSSGAGEPCEPRRAVPAEVAAVRWWLDADHPAPGPSDTELNILVGTAECTSGEPVGDRLLEPQIDVTDHEVVIGLAARPLPAGGYTCPGIPPEPVVIELPEPLGNRAVVDTFDLAPRSPVERVDSTEAFLG
jgi:hypothetical protein